MRFFLVLFVAVVLIFAAVSYFEPSQAWWSVPTDFSLLIGFVFQATQRKHDAAIRAGAQKAENSNYLCWAVLLGIIFGGIFAYFQGCAWIIWLLVACVGAGLVLIGAVASDLNDDEREAAKRAKARERAKKKSNGGTIEKLTDKTLAQYVGWHLQTFDRCFFQGKVTSLKIRDGELIAERAWVATRESSGVWKIDSGSENVRAAGFKAPVFPGAAIYWDGPNTRSINNGRGYIAVLLRKGNSYWLDPATVPGLLTTTEA